MDDENDTETGYFWSWAPVAYRGEVLVFGLPLFGWWLPYIGFEKIQGYKGLLLEWWLRGVFIAWGETDED